MTDPGTQGPTWKRIAVLALWLVLAFPIGLWKLYQDDTLSTSTKWRVLVYIGLLPMLLYITVSIWMTSSALQQAQSKRWQESR